MEKIIDEFIKQYNVEYDYYTNLSKTCCEVCEKELSAMGIKAITSWRAKSIESLRLKLLKRDREKKYQTIEDIKSDIADFSGVRIALYFPNEREAVDQLINSLFNVIKTKSFPDQKQNPTYKKRFSGYWATHYRVMLKPDSNHRSRYTDSIVEIQVASVLMHSWSEIEHDLVYKPTNGDLSEEELQILDEINGLVLVGEVALERLQKAISKRTTKVNTIDNSYELKNYLSNYILDINTKNIGNIKFLNDVMKDLNYNNKSKFDKIVKNMKHYNNDTIADELIDNIISDYIKNKQTKVPTNISKSGFEKFMKLWILWEKINNSLRSDENDRVKSDLLNQNEIFLLKQYRNIRNEIIHGMKSYGNEFLLSKCNALSVIIDKLIMGIDDNNIKNQFYSELKGIMK
jgi:ppGpp synthetase/RelA/SpoT-type nucleotidyltranferase